MPLEKVFADVVNSLATRHATPDQSMEYTGTTTLKAPIAQAWKRVKPARRRGLHPYRATVIVAS